MGFPADAFIHALAWTGATVGGLIAVAFVAGLILRRHNIVDSFWGLLFAGIAVAALMTSDGHGDPFRRWLLAAMTGIWGLRLAVHVGRRSWGKGEDPRYEKLLERGSAHPIVNAIGKIYLPQAVLAFVISAPVQVGTFERGGVGIIAVIGVLVWAVGVFFETVGDAQMERYKRWRKAQPADEVEGSVMDKGLWRYTRHPNYFGDACVWWGLFLVAAEHWPGVLTLPSVAIMTYLLTQGSGKRNLERSMVKRPGYPEYMKRTSGFLPLPPRKPELSL